MYKVMITATILVGLALAPFLTRSVDHPDPRDREAAPIVETERPTQLEPAAKAPSCSWECRACAEDEGCTQLCTEVGDCASTCNVLAQCDASHTWDERSCSCVAI